MDTIKRNYTTVNNWVKTMRSLCGLNIMFKISVYNTLSFNVDDCCFEVVTSLENIETHFGEYFIYYAKTDRYGETNTPCIKLLICKNRPNKEFWVEHIVEYVKED